MKCVLVLVGFVAAAHAGILAPAAPALLSTGASVQSRSQDGLGNYAFAYDEAGATGGTFRRESGSPAGVVVGSYGLRAADGRQRIVNYVADAAGFRANVQTNEPGVDPSQDPAATLINKAGIAVAAPAAPLALAAPAPAIAAPLPLAAAPAIAAPAIPGPLSLAAAPAIAAPAIAAPAIPGPLSLAAPALPAIAPAGLPASSISIPSYGGLTTIQATGPLAAPAAPLPLGYASNAILGAPSLLAAKYF